MFPIPEDPDVVFACACHDRAARFVMEDRVFVGQFRGSIATTIQQPKTDARGMQTIPLNIVGYSTQSDVEGLGRVSLDFGFSRAVPASTVRGDPRADFFPATQTMHLQILMTAGVFPGITLVSRRRGTLVNDFAESFPPPKGATYTLQRPVELVDPANPKKTLISLVTVNTQILTTRMAPRKLRVGRGCCCTWAARASARPRRRPSPCRATERWWCASLAPTGAPCATTKRSG